MLLHIQPLPNNWTTRLEETLIVFENKESLATLVGKIKKTTAIFGTKRVVIWNGVTLMNTTKPLTYRFWSFQESYLEGCKQQLHWVPNTDLNLRVGQQLWMSTKLKFQSSQRQSLKDEKTNNCKRYCSHQIVKSDAWWCIADIHEILDLQDSASSKVNYGDQLNVLPTMPLTKAASGKTVTLQNRFERCLNAQLRRRINLHRGSMACQAVWFNRK